MDIYMYIYIYIHIYVQKKIITRMHLGTSFAFALACPQMDA